MAEWKRVSLQSVIAGGTCKAIGLSSDGGILYASNYYSEGYLSRDGGKTFSSAPAQELLSASEDFGVAYCYASGGIAVSTDGAATFSLVLGQTSDSGWVGTPETLRVSGDGSATFYLHAGDAGVSIKKRTVGAWSEVFADASPVSATPGLFVSRDGKICLATVKTSVCLSKDGGTTWGGLIALHDANGNAITTGELIGVAGSNDGATLIVYDASHLYVSTDAGAHWSIRSAPAATLRDCECSASGDMLVACCGTTPYTSLDLGASWEQAPILLDGANVDVGFARSLVVGNGGGFAMYEYTFGGSESNLLVHAGASLEKMFFTGYVGCAESVT